MAPHLCTYTVLGLSLLYDIILLTIVGYKFGENIAGIIGCLQGIIGN